MQRAALVVLLAVAGGSTLIAQSGPARGALLSQADRRESTRRLLSLLRETDPASSDGLYEAQQEGMALAAAVFTFGTPQEQDTVLAAAAAQVRMLPTAGQLADSSVVSASIGAIELLSPALTKLRQRIGALGFSVDGVALPRAGPSRVRRVWPILVGGKINVLSEVEMQYAYLLSTMVRLATEHPLPASQRESAARRSSLNTLFDFLLHDKVRFYWAEAPAWHWSGPFPNMRERVRTKLAYSDPRVTRPRWFGAIVDHELHLFAVAADLIAATRADPRLAARTAPADAAMLGDIRATTLLMLHARVSDGPRQSGFLFDYGYWTDNPSYGYAGCASSHPLPLVPCPVPIVATDVSHARRWPWWLASFQAAWPPGSPARAEMEGYTRRLAAQFADVVLRADPEGRPLTSNYMDGRDGWYHYRDFPGQLGGFGPTSLTGSLRYGSWALLGVWRPEIAAAHLRLCALLVSTEPADVIFRTRYYGSASADPALAGLGDRDLYGPGSLYALTCRIGSALGYY